MASIQNIISAGDAILYNAPLQLMKGARSAELLIYAALMEIFKNVDITAGVLSSTPKAEEFLAALDYKIYLALRSSGYAASVNGYVGSYDTLTENLKALHSAMGNGDISGKAINEIKRIEKSNVISNLTEKGLYTDIIAPIRKDLYRNIMFGATIDETEAMIRSYVVSTEGKDSKLIRYVNQIATDSIHQYEGTIQQETKSRLKLNATQYVGSIIEDSRAQCRKWTDGKIIKDEDLKAEIQFALDKKYYKGHKCSGMIPGTDTHNFCILRGGFYCRHRAIPIYISSKKK